MQMPRGISDVPDLQDGKTYETEAKQDREESDMNPKCQLRGRVCSDGADGVGGSGMLVTGEKLGLRNMVQ
jgi:hypothetical protein